jgi:hypothetical protein
MKKQIMIEAEKYNEMLHKQGYKCAICGDPPPLRSKLALDHDHITGKIELMEGCKSC